MTQPFFDVRMKGFRDRAEVADVLALLDGRTAPLAGDPVAAVGAAGRVLAAPVVAGANVPGFARAAMDGYAVRAADTFGADPLNPLPLAVVGEARPARPFGGTVQPGQAVRITTGSPVPAGADAVLMAEVAELQPDGRVLAREAVAPGRHVGRVGEDVAVGREVLPAGRVLRPQDVGLIVSVGVGTVAVVRRPRVAVLVTGDELLPPGAVPDGFRIVDSNSPMLAALVARDGGEVLPAEYLPDRYEAVRDAIRDADADVVLVSGGSSVGAEDHAPRAVAELGELAVHGVALRPASPLGVGFLVQTPPPPLPAAERGDKTSHPVPVPPPPRGEGVRGRGLSNVRPVFLLPGNPVSCLCGYDLFAGRVVRRLGGRGWGLPYRRQSVPLASKIVSAVGRVDYVRVRRAGGGVEPVAVGGASLLSTTTVADGFVLVDRDREGHAPGDEVEVWWYD